MEYYLLGFVMGYLVIRYLPDILIKIAKYFKWL